MSDLFETLQKSEATLSLLNKKGRFVVDDTLGVSLLLASAYKKKPGRYVLITSNLYNAQKNYDLLSTFLGENNVLLFPNEEALRAEAVASSKELLAQRIFVMGEALKNENKIIVAHASAVMKFLPDPKLFQSLCFNISVGGIYEISSLKKTLVEAGYSLVNKIDQSLQFASRGDILDIFSVNYANPIRIEFFGDEVESIKFFDISTQSSNQSIKEIIIFPATDIIYKENEITLIDDKVSIQLAKDKTIIGEELFERLKAIVNEDVSNIKDKKYHANLYKYFGYFSEEHFSILDYFKSELIFVANKDQILSSSNLVLQESTDYFMSLFEEGRIMSHLFLYEGIDCIINRKSNVIFANTFSESSKDIIFNVRPILTNGASLSFLRQTIESYLSTNDKLILALASKQQIDTAIDVLQEAKIDYEKVENFNIPTKKVGISLFPLEEGFELVDYKIAVISSKELYGYRNHNSRFLSRFKEATILRSYEDLLPGDYVVHEYNGIGKFLDIKTLEIDGVHTDFLHIAYAGSDVLYVPLSQFRLVRKYSGKEGAAPKLNRLNGGEWEKTKAKIKNRVNELADRLIALYSERAKVKGFAFAKDDELQKAFENQFPFELTEDQNQSMNEIKKDMESDSVMDRLLCGDVGFGKTEVAFRAAFKAILSGKQVALLCPTTLLARQHYERAMERFSDFSINIAVFSRLIPEQKEKYYSKEIANGNINLIIGTHRLLSKDLHFNDLGLLIVDEEQRFGVEQKEKIKELKTNVDVLTLSATPIPRTLQISLLGIRQLSQINTAPTNRMPIQTYVTPYREDIIKELIERELSRDGQVFYLHNNVSTIYSCASRIQRYAKDGRIGVVHGKMDRDEIEDVMMKFYNCELNVLVCTSIIENGIDIANANMIIVEDADKFGLSQLYQIKGRVGRGNRISYAYLLYREQKEMNEKARLRLKAIQDFTELGSGYKIAQRDLMIRGAGDILGPEQAGFIDSIGIDLYLKLLNEAIDSKKNGAEVKPPKALKQFSIDAYIPKEYAENSDKIELYQEIESTKSLVEVENLKKKIRDIYGRLPEEVELLFRKRKIDILLEEEEFSDLVDYKEYCDIILSKDFSRLNGIGNALFESLSAYLKILKVSFINRELKIRLKKENTWLIDLENILLIVDKTYKSSVKH